MELKHKDEISVKPKFLSAQPALALVTPSPNVLEDHEEIMDFDEEEEDVSVSSETEIAGENYEAIK